MTSSNVRVVACRAALPPAAGEDGGVPGGRQEDGAPGSPQARLVVVRPWPGVAGPPGTGLAPPRPLCLALPLLMACPVHLPPGVDCADLVVDPRLRASLRVAVLSRGIGGQAVFSCAPGHGLVGNTHSVCQANGEWSRPHPTCQVVNCEPPGTPEHGYTTGQGPPYRAGDIVQFNCNQQFMMEGQPIIACQENGRWSGSVPKCKQLSR